MSDAYGKEYFDACRQPGVIGVHEVDDLDDVFDCDSDEERTWSTVAVVRIDAP